MTTIRERFALLRAEAPDAAAVVVRDGQWWTWGDLKRVADSLDGVLNDLGLGAGTRVGLVVENRSAHVAAIFAVLATDRCLTTLSALQPPERLAADIRDSELAVVVASPEVLEHAGVHAAIVAAGRAIGLGADGELLVGSGLDAAGAITTAPINTAPINTAPHQGSSTPAFAPGVAIEMLTSGTTGPPKRVQLSDEQVSASLSSAHIPARCVDGIPVMSRGHSIVATPLVHIGGLWGVLSTLYAARRIVLMDRFRLDEWVEAVHAYRPRTAGLVPAAMRTLLEAEVDPALLASLQVITSGTAPCPVELADAFTRQYGIAVLVTYGATEFAGAVAGWTYALHKEWWDRKKGSTGRAYPGVTLRIVDERGVEVAPNAVGQLQVRTPQAAALSGGWTPTSDLARLDCDGFLWIEGRLDDAIIRGGFKVHPEAVKRVLEKHGSVSEAAVAGLPDSRLGAVPVAAVELRPGMASPTPEELIALCRQHLAPYEVPVEVRIVGELPRSAAMKISRVELLEIFADRVPA